MQLHRAGADVSVVAWGERLGAMRRRTSRDGPCNCTGDASELGVQRYLIICLKAQSIPGAVEAMRPPIGMDTKPTREASSLRRQRLERRCAEKPIIRQEHPEERS